jgi:hypothetical protein
MSIAPRAASIKIALGLAVAASASWAQAPSTTAPPTKAAAEKRPPDPLEREKLEFFRDRIGNVKLTVAARPDAPCKFVAEPLTKFDNPISQIWDGFMFLWTDRGRPVAVVKSYHNSPNKTWGRTFVSLAPQPIVMKQGDQPLWTPEKAGVTFAELPDAPEPSAEARQRLTQMRQIARRFSVIDHWGIKDPTDWQLRLLPTPLYRYEVLEEGVVDGALFGYVLTAPEAIVLLEARKTDTGGLAWHYALSRCTRFGVRFSLDGKKIAEFDRLDAWPATGTYFHHPQPWEEYPFKAQPAPVAPE